MRRFFVFIVLLSLSVVLSAQNDTATIYGHLSDDNGHSIGLINILIEGTTIGTSSNDDGNYRLQVPADTPITIQYSIIGFKTQKKNRYPQTERFSKTQFDIASRSQPPYRSFGKRHPATQRQYDTN